MGQAICARHPQASSLQGDEPGFARVGSLVRCTNFQLHVWVLITLAAESRGAISSEGGLPATPFTPKAQGGDSRIFL